MGQHVVLLVVLLYCHLDLLQFQEKTLGILKVGEEKLGTEAFLELLSSNLAHISTKHSLCSLSPNKISP